MGKIKQSTNQVWVYMDDDMKTELHRMANQDKVNMSEFVRRLLNREIETRAVCPPSIRKDHPSLWVYDSTDEQMEDSSKPRPLMSIVK
jgi:cytidylate kinase